MSETPQGTWLGGARKRSLWLCCAGPLPGRQKSGISDNQRRLKMTPWQRNSWESFERRKMRKKSQPQNEGERVHRLRVRFGRERRASRLPCLSVGLGDDRRGMSGSGDVSQTTFITSISGSKSHTSFTNRTFHFSGPQGFGMAFDAAERNGRFGCETVRVEVRSKVIPASFLKIEERRTFVKAKDRRKKNGR